MKIKTTTHFNKNNEYVLTIWLKRSIPTTFKAISTIDHRELINEIFTKVKEIGEIRIK